MPPRDVFISHASEDKDAIARPLAEQLRAVEVSVWFDEYELMLGDSLRGTIADGLRHSRVGVVILSPSFFSKRWPQWELDGLNARQIAGEPNVILPVWHDVGLDDVRWYSAPLADVVAAKSSDGVEAIVHRIVRVLNRLAAGDAPEHALAEATPGITESEAGDLPRAVQPSRDLTALRESHDRSSESSPAAVGPDEASTEAERHSKRSLLSVITSLQAIITAVAVLLVAGAGIASLLTAGDDSKRDDGSAAPPAPPSTTTDTESDASDTLRDDGELSAASEGFLVSANGRYRLTMQRNSNLVLSGPNRRALWETNTAGHGAAKVRMQSDGNLVIYDSADRSIWDSRTADHPHTFLIVRNDGKAVIYSGKRVIWVNGVRR